MNKLKSKDFALLEQLNYYRLLALLRVYYITGELDREEVAKELNKIGELPL